MTFDAGIGRRQLLRGGAAALAGAALTPQAAARAVDVRWDRTVDVLVIGTGFAGLAAAFEAHRAGRRVLLLDKRRIPGGNSLINGGYLGAAGSSFQRRAGIEDGPERMLDDMLRAGRELNHRALARTVCERSVETLDWVIDEFGVEFHEVPRLLGGHSAARSHRTRNDSGSGIVRPMLDRLEAEEVPLLTEQRMDALVRDDAGHVVGLRVVAEGEAADGSARHLRARHGVVLAAGGFSSDVAYRQVQDPRLGPELSHTNRSGSDARPLLAAAGAGAVTLQESWIQLGPWASPDERGIGVGSTFNIESAFPYGILVDPATGKRIVDELADRKTRADAILETGHPCVALCDARAAEREDQLALLLEQGVVRRFDDLEALARAWEMPEGALQDTLERYNGFVRAGTDAAYGKRILEDAAPIAEPPFYAIRTWPKVHHTMGGVHIDAEARVIGHDLNPVPGLFAAGEITGGVHGAVRLGSCAVTDCLVFGRIAGRHAAA